MTIVNPAHYGTLMSKKTKILTQKGFTLVEIIAGLTIMGILGSVAANKFDLLSAGAGGRALQVMINELNSRECLTWKNIKLSNTGWTNDAVVYAAIDTDLGAGFKWNPQPTVAGGTLHFKSKSITLTRTPSTNTAQGKWE